MNVYYATNDYITTADYAGTDGITAADLKAKFPALTKYSAFMAQPAVRIVNMAVSGALAYHGYKRNHSIFWAVVWGLLVPNVVGLPIALAQGFGKPQ